MIFLICPRIFFKLLIICTHQPLELAAAVAADVHRLIRSRAERAAILPEADLLEIPHVLIKRSQVASLCAATKLDDLNRKLDRKELSTDEAKEEAIRFFEQYDFNCDGQFSVFDSERFTIYHKMKYMIGRHFEFNDVDFSPLFQAVSDATSGEIIKWVDCLSSDYLFSPSEPFGAQANREWIRVNFAPYFYCERWDWHILAESHNEIHTVDPDKVENLLAQCRQYGWLVLA